MTVIDNLEVDIRYIKNDIKEAIINNQPIDKKLNVIIVVSNPCQYKRRFILAREFIQRIEKESNVELFVVELAYGSHTFHVTDSNNKNHLQLHTYTEPLWHKENMIRVGIEKLFPRDWTNVAWVDADIEFDNANWALDTLKILNGTRDVVQVFSHVLDMDPQLDPMTIFSGFGYQYTQHRKYIRCTGLKYFHPGMAWACTRKAYDQMGGIFDKSILGSGDYNMALSFVGQGKESLSQESSSDYKQSVIDFQNLAEGLTLGYVPGVIRHYYHGAKKNRKYTERWKILVKYNYQPSKHLTRDENGLLIPTKECPREFLNEIYQYFSERNEDEGFEEWL
jgi:hypothetical protein